MEPPCLFMLSVTQVAVKRKKAVCRKGKTSMFILFVNQFLEFPIISNLSPTGDQDLKERVGVFRQWWSGHVLGYTRAGFNSLLWIKRLTKMKLAHGKVIPARLGSGALQTHSPPRVVTFSVPITTTPNPETHFQRQASMQGEYSHENLLGLMNPFFPDFLIFF